MSSDSQPPSPAAGTKDGERLVKLALCIKERPAISYAEIRAALPGEYGAGTGSETAARRRFERDKETLRSYGVFIVADERARYSIDEKASYAAPIELTDAQASLLRLTCNALLEDESYPLKNELRMILAKIGDDIDVPDLLPSMQADDSPSRRRPLAGLEKVRRAISNRKLLRFEYRDARGHDSKREVEPFGCFLLNKNCYVVAFDPAANDERVFRLDRMRKLSVNAKSPARPDFEEREFDAAKYYGLPFQFGEEDYMARVGFDAENSWRAQRLSMGQGSFEDGADGRLAWNVRTRDTEGLARWCVENGPGIAPIAPARAREAYTRGVAAALASFETSDAHDRNRGAR